MRHRNLESQLRRPPRTLAGHCTQAGQIEKELKEPAVAPRVLYEGKFASRQNNSVAAAQTFPDAALRFIHFFGAMKWWYF